MMQVVTEKATYCAKETVHGIIYISVNPPMFDGEAMEASYLKLKVKGTETASIKTYST